VVEAVDPPDHEGPGIAMFVIPSGHVAFVGSRGEFARAERFGPAGSFTSVATMPIGDGRRELRLFLLPPGVALRGVKKVPGFNIQVLHPGTRIVVRVVAPDPSDLD